MDLVMRTDVVYHGERKPDGSFEVYAGERRLDPTRAVEAYGTGGPREYGWGYVGGGARLLATGILNDFLFGDAEEANRLHIAFAEQFVENWDMDGSWTLPGKQIAAFVQQIGE